MPSSLNLTREQLAKFLPNHEAIKAFEDLFALVSENLPISETELAALVAGIQRVDVDSIRRMVEALEQVQQPRLSLNQLEKRVEALEKQQPARPNLHPIETRLGAIESVLGI